jgi:hypothetical protein
MPRLVFSSERGGCGGTIELDNGETCLISVAQSGVLVRSYKKGFLSGLLGSFFGPILYREQNVYRAARTAAALDSKHVQVASLKFQNPRVDRFCQCRLALLVGGGGSDHA